MSGVWFVYTELEYRTCSESPMIAGIFSVVQIYGFLWVWVCFRLRKQTFCIIRKDHAAGETESVLLWVV